MDAPKRSLARTSVLLVPAFAGLVASSILVIDYVRPAPVFCDPDSGCAALRQTIFASLLGVPTPVLGVVGFLAIGFLALVPGKTARRALATVSSLAAFFALFLLSIQALAATWCKFCLVADISACVACGGALWRLIGGWDPPETRAPRLASGLALGLAVVVPITVGSFKKVIVPDVIVREIAQTPPGEVTIVDFADFQCPFCRMTHAMLAPLVAEHRDKIRLVRKNVPLTRLHAHALDAARAACCGEQMGKGEAMADALFSAPEDDLTPEGCAKLAVSLGLDEAAFDQCTRDPATDARIQADQATFKASHGHGLPTLWINDEKIEGYPGDGALEKALQRALGRQS